MIIPEIGTALRNPSDPASVRSLLYGAGGAGALGEQVSPRMLRPVSYITGTAVGPASYPVSSGMVPAFWYYQGTDFGFFQNKFTGTMIPEINQVDYTGLPGSDYYLSSFTKRLDPEGESHHDFLTYTRTWNIGTYTEGGQERFGFYHGPWDDEGEIGLLNYSTSKTDGGVKGVQVGAVMDYSLDYATQSLSGLLTRDTIVAMVTTWAGLEPVLRDSVAGVWSQSPRAVTTETTSGNGGGASAMHIKFAGYPAWAAEQGILSSEIPPVAVYDKLTRRNAPIIYDTSDEATRHNEAGIHIYGNGTREDLLDNPIAEARWADAFGCYDPAPGALASLGLRPGELLASAYAAAEAAAHGEVLENRLFSADGSTYRVTLVVGEGEDQASAEDDELVTVMVAPGAPGVVGAVTAVRMIGRKVGETYVDVTDSAKLAPVPGPGVALLVTGRVRRGGLWGFAALDGSPDVRWARRVMRVSATL